MGLHVRLTTSVAGPRRVCTKIVGTIGGGVRIDIWYHPEMKDQSTNIVFIQVMREWLDDVASPPSKLVRPFRYRDLDTTAKFWHVDFVEGERDPYYNGDDSQDTGHPGMAIEPLLIMGIQTPRIRRSAWIVDAPAYDVSFPGGGSKMKWEFRTAAFSAAGVDAGAYYAYQDWTYEMNRTGAEKLTLGETGFDPGQDFKDAVNLWCAGHNFPLPPPPPPRPPSAIHTLHMRNPAGPYPYGRTIYVVKPNDRLPQIAQRLYANPNLWPKIYEANKAVIGTNPNLLKPGTELVVPDLSYYSGE